MKYVELVLNRFNKIDESDTIHLWESRISPYFEFVDPHTLESYLLKETLVKEAIAKHFSDVTKNIMCGKSFISPKVEYFVRLFLSNEEEGHFIVKYSNAEIIILIPIDEGN